MKKLDFESVGKRMPYDVPEGYFDSLAESVLAKAKVDAELHRMHVKRGVILAACSSVATAVMIAVLLIPVGDRMGVGRSETEVAVEQSAACNTESIDYVLQSMSDDEINFQMNVALSDPLEMY